MQMTILILMRTHFCRMLTNRQAVWFRALNKGKDQQGEQVCKNALHQFYKCIAIYGQSCPRCYAFGLHQTGKSAKSRNSQGQGCFLRCRKSISNFLYSACDLKQSGKKCGERCGERQFTDKSREHGKKDNIAAYFCNGGKTFGDTAV